MNDLSANENTGELPHGQPNYVLSYDILNIAACLAVIALHVNGAVWTFSYGRYWKTSMITETVFYWAVPVFFMLTGATLMDYRQRYDTREYFQKRFAKTVVPFLFWSLVSIPWALFVSHYLKPEAVSTWQGILDTIFNAKAMSIYWFFPPLFSLYLCVPILSLIPMASRKRAFGFLIGYAFVTSATLPLLCQLCGVTYNYALESPLNAGGYVIFVLLGYYLTRYPIKKTARYLLYFLGAFGWAVRYFGTLTRSYAAGDIDRTFFGYQLLPSVLLAVAVFVWFQYHDWSFFGTPRRIKWVRLLSGASFGIYLVHFYFLRFVVDTFQIDMRCWEWRLFGVPLVYLAALGITLVIKKIPGVRRILP
jgi:surface polysaccharide O-acyltransferase-like enzyme